MGYALFAMRKIYYTNLVNTLQLKLTNIENQYEKMLNFAANISDGKVTVEEIASDPTNFGNYAEYLQGAQAYIETADDEGGAGTTVGEIGQMATDQNYSEEYLASIAEMLNESVNEEYAKQMTKKITAQENILEMQKKRIETKLTAAQNELQAVEEAEGKAIEKATPKYSGVG